MEASLIQFTLIEQIQKIALFRLKLFCQKFTDMFQTQDFS